MVVSVCRRWLALAAAFGITPMIALAATDDGTITVGKFGGGGLPLCFWGYSSSSIAFGSYSPTGLTGGRTVAYLNTDVTGPNCLGGFYGNFGASGFSSDPGQSWLTSVTCNGTTKLGAIATYSYSSGTAQWTWSFTTWDFPSKAGSQFACTIVHG